MRLSNAYRETGITRSNLNYNKHDNLRSASSLNHRILPSFNASPRSIIEVRGRQQVGQKMRMMKSKIGNISVHSRNGTNQNNLYPAELIFLLSNQQGNVDHIRKLIEDEKRRVDRDFENFTRQIIHIIEDLKLSIYAQLDFVFMNFIEIYKSMKDQVVRMRENRRRIIQNMPKEQFQGRPPVKSQIISNNNVSNLNILQQISRDEDYFRNHRMYQEITNAYYEAIGPIMNDAQNILSIGSEVQFYKDDRCNQILTQMRNNFFKDTKEIYDRELDSLVTQVKNLIEDNNMLLKGLNIDQPKTDKMQEYSYKPYQAQKQSRMTNKSGGLNGYNKKKRIQTETSPYGFQPPAPKFKNYFEEDQNSKVANRIRPSSSVDTLKLRQRPESQRSARRQFEEDKKRYIINTGNADTLPIRLNSIKTTRDQQNALLQKAQSLRLQKRGIIINNVNSQDILLCVVFINNGRHVAIGSKDRNIYVYQVSTGKSIQILSGHRASVCSLFNFHNFFASGGDNGCGSLILWQPEQLKMKKKVNLHSAALSCIVDLMDGSHLATGGYDRKIFVYNYKRGEPAFELSSCRSGVTSMIVCQQSRKLISSGLDSTLTIWNIFLKNKDIQNITLQRIITNCGLVCSLRPLILIHDIFLVGNKDGKVLAVNVYSGQTMKSLTVGRGSVIQMAVIQRRNKSQYPIIMTCCNGQREMFFTKFDSGLSQSSKARIGVNFGCGIGPKLIISDSGTIGIVNQTSAQKQVALYDIEAS